MTMQIKVSELVRYGSLPRADEAEPEFLEGFQSLLLDVVRPVTDEEAIELTKLLGPDDCYGIAWTLVHIIEEAPGWPLKQAILAAPAEWAGVLDSRSAS
ncbi:hypothetical protein [Sphingomonas sp.]|uniref:hypothetical protein n=1 Tax=Sphingomonas sp. TaxID=28214 RepID=UPI001ECD53EB|nr:hypothetical protein [Sphingomonas sp.]MBX3595645.1 hypothetical protein [Sphingomonas sp.]